MQYINPIEILGLINITEASNINNDIIKKAKRKLFAEIDLSDEGLFNYKGIFLTKTDCEKTIYDLENPDYLEFYLYLAINNQPLNDFLLNGDESFFYKFSHESIYNLPEFACFISPYFATRFDKALWKSFVDFKNNSINSKVKARNILKTQIIIEPSDINTAFKSLSVEIKRRINQIDTITGEIKNETTEYTDENIDDIDGLVKDMFPNAFLNLLPPYFLSLNNKIAASINFLQLAIWNTFNDTSICRSLLENILDLKIESVSKRTFEKNFEIVKKEDEKRQEQEKNQRHIEKLFVLLNSFESKAKTIYNARQLIYQSKTYLFNIKAILQGNSNTYLSLSTRVASVAQSFIIEDVNNVQSSNNKFDNVLGFPTLKSVLKNAWEVTQLIGSLEMQDDFIVNRYNPNKETLKDICNKFSVATPLLTLGKLPQCNFVIIDGTITHSGKDNKSLPISNPFIRNDVRYIGLNMEVEALGVPEALENQSLQFYLIYIQPDGKIKSNTSSPIGFTMSSNEIIKSWADGAVFHFSGWGNSEKGTYEVGTHYIEVWLDNCMIYRKSFVVDWSPEEKIENAKRETEKRERERIEAEKRKEKARIEEQKAKEKKVRTFCVWIMVIFIGLAVVFAIWGTEGLETIGSIVGFFAILLVIGLIINWLKRL